jgi:hypothetical protein
VLQPKHITAALVFAAFGTAAFAQNTVDNSVYSRFGLGDLLSNETLQSAAQGGTSTTWSAVNSMNSSNPAALGSLNLTEYSIGIYGKYGMVRTATQSAETYATNINHLSLALPVFNPINEIGVKKKRDWKWGVGIGLRPYSQVAYDIAKTADEGAMGSVTRSYVGNGGTYQLNLDNGFKWKNISAGVSMQYLFGKAEYDRRVFFSDSLTPFNNTVRPYADVFVDNISYSGLGVKIGGQYEYIVTQQGSENADDFRRRDKKRLIAGVTYAPSFNLKARNTFVRSAGSGDIITGGVNENGSAVMPGSLSLGWRFLKDNHWQIAAQYDSKSWSEYTNSERPETLKNTTAFRLGGEWTPNYKSFTSYGSRMTYRFGVFTATDPRIVRNTGEQLSANAITMGIGMPIRLPRGMSSHCNINLELGEQGTSVLKENYARFTLGFTLNDHLWFARPKYN